LLASIYPEKVWQGNCFYLDRWPLGPRRLFIADPELVSQYVTTTQSLPKSPLEADYLSRFLGDNNMVGIDGQQWKWLRSIFNPGFSASHLMTLVPYIVGKSLVFCDVIREKAIWKELIELEEHVGKAQSGYDR
jgi:cytochrome P450